MHSECACLNLKKRSIWSNWTVSLQSSIFHIVETQPSNLNHLLFITICAIQYSQINISTQRSLLHGTFKLFAWPKESWIANIPTIQYLLYPPSLVRSYEKFILHVCCWREGMEGDDVRDIIFTWAHMYIVAPNFILWQDSRQHSTAFVALLQAVCSISDCQNGG